ncbi:hypothetical protein TNCV_4615541 [Trichonephila clavipes]|nr:hypothetical protein TNCV_4615541 [Trichonephila clavipes]
MFRVLHRFYVAYTPDVGKPTQGPKDPVAQVVRKSSLVQPSEDIQTSKKMRMAIVIGRSNPFLASTDTIHLQTSMSFPGLEPRPFVAAISVTNPYPVWAAVESVSPSIEMNLLSRRISSMPDICLSENYNNRLLFPFCNTTVTLSVKTDLNM